MQRCRTAVHGSASAPTPVHPNNTGQEECVNTKGIIMLRNVRPCLQHPNTWLLPDITAPVTRRCTLRASLGKSWRPLQMEEQQSKAAASFFYAAPGTHTTILLTL